MASLPLNKKATVGFSWDMQHYKSRGHMTSTEVPVSSWDHSIPRKEGKGLYA